MLVTMGEVRAAVQPDEPDYDAAAARLGLEALPLLTEIIHGADPALASKAATLAGSIGGSAALDVLASAAQSSEVVVRIAAAAAVGRLSEAPVTDLLITLLRDDDPYVRKVALDSVEAVRAVGTAETVRVLARQDPEEFVRDVAENVAGVLGSGVGGGG